MTKRCLDCGTDRPLDDFPPAAKGRLGRGSYCKPCMRARSRASYRKRSLERGHVVREPVQVPDGHRRCPDCERIVPQAEFVRSYCKPCHNARGRRSREKVGGSRNYHLQARYGISAQDAAAMLERQGGLCAVCRERPAEHVDHDHETGAVRGMLCFTCNVGLGNFRDREDLLLKAFDYLRGIEPGSYESALLDLDPTELWGPEPDPVTGLPG